MGKYYTVKGGARGFQMVLTPEMIVAAKNNPSIRLTTSPFGLTVEDLQLGRKVVYAGRAVPWKGKKGREFEEAAPSGVVEGLRKARDLSMRHREKGVAILPDGRIVPRKVYEMMKEAGKI